MYRFIISLILLSTNASIYACDCGPGLFSVEDYNEISVIFIGRYVGYTVDKEHPVLSKINEFVVSTWYKGDDKTKKISIRDSWDSGRCGIGMLTPGMEYLVYAHKRDTLLWTSMCDRTTFVPQPQTKLSKSTDSIIHMWYKYSIHDSTHFVTDTTQLRKIILSVQKDGYKKFMHRNGNIMATGTYKNGKPTGMWKYYDWFGRLDEVGIYKNGLRDSIWAQYTYKHINGKPDYNSNASQIWFLQEYNDGQPTLWRIWYQNDYPKKSSETYKIDSIDRWIHKNYHHNGKLRNVYMYGPEWYDKHGRMREGHMEGLYKEYHENGEIKEEGELYKSREVGIWKEFDEHGKIIKIRAELTKQEVDKMKDIITR